MNIVKGKVERVATHPNNRYGLKINGIWVNGFGSPPAQEGEYVELEYKEVEKNGKVFRNIPDTEKKDQSNTPKPAQRNQTQTKSQYWAEKDAKQARMAGLKDICLILEPSNKPLEEKIKIAEQYARKWARWIETGSWFSS